MIIDDSPGLRITFDAKNGWVCFEFKGFVEGDGYRRPLEVALKTLVARKATKILWDCRRMKVLTAEDQAWAERDWTPRMVKEAKVRRSAILVPQSVVAQMSVRRVQDKAARLMDNEFETKHFDKLDAAETWLRGGS